MGGNSWPNGTKYYATKNVKAYLRFLCPTSERFTAMPKPPSEHRAGSKAPARSAREDAAPSLDSSHPGHDRGEKARGWSPRGPGSDLPPPPQAVGRGSGQLTLGTGRERTGTDWSPHRQSSNLGAAPSPGTVGFHLGLSHPKLLMFVK